MRQNILITGASSGLGEQMAREFAGMGRDLALCARRTDRLHRLRAGLATEHPGRAVSVGQLDVNDHDRVFEVFDAFASEFGTIDRVVVNAGVGHGQPLGTGRFDVNLRTAQTNFVAALAQCEAAMSVFRRQGSGHLVMISSVSAFRGLPRNNATYAASKAAVAALAEGVRAEMIGTPIRVSTIYPGYIRSELTEGIPASPLMSGVRPGVRAMVRAIEREQAKASVPPWPWVPLGFAMRYMPLWVLGRFA